jgi:hypothetical protein
MDKMYNPVRRGSVLPLALIAVILLLMMGTSLLSMGVTNRIYTIRNTSEVVSRCAADAGMTQALFTMNTRLADNTLLTDTLPFSYNTELLDSDANYSYIVTGSLAEGYQIVSVGESGNSKRMITASIELAGLFDHAILTKEQLILKAKTTVVAYDSSDPTATDVPLTIGTQDTKSSSIILNNSVIVGGDVAVGMGGDVDTIIKDLGATIEGDKYASTVKYPMPSITVPTLPFIGTSLSVKSGTITVTPANNGTYSSINLQNGKNIGKLEVSGGDVELHITGNISLGNDCEIDIADGSTLKLYVDGNITCNNGSGINTDAPPEEASTLQLFATGSKAQTIDLKAKSEWTGTVYAPNGNVTLYAKGDAYGSIVAKSFEFKAGGNFHYDAALKKVTITDPGVRFAITKWKEGKLTADTIDWEKLTMIESGILLE